MDGASKFVRGDAIAGLLVVFINIIGGMIIGIAQQGRLPMPLIPTQSLRLVMVWSHRCPR
jgi:type III secretory pathway component EscV